MCGIAGDFDVTRGGSRSAVEAMITGLRHRGPDGSGVAARGAGVVGSSRLAIRGHAGQRVPVEGHRWTLAYNGELYAALGRTCDTRWLLSRLEARGPRALEQL